MLRLFVCLFIFIFSVMLPCASAAAMEGSAPLARGGSGDAVWSISALTGFQHMDLNFSAPYLRGPFVVELASPSPLDLRLHNANLWVNGIDGEVRKGRFSGFLGLKGSAPRDGDVATPSEPFWGGFYPVQWRDDQLKWWSINAGAGMDITAHFTIQAGLRVEHLSLGLNNPTDTLGLINYYHNTFGDVYSGNLKSDLLIPWVGLQVRESRLDGSLRFSPIAYTHLNIPLDYTAVFSPTVTTLEQSHYTFRNNGFWLEGNLAYDIYKTAKWRFSLWSTASWLWTRGGTNDDYQATLYRSGLPATTLLANSSYVTSSYIVGIYRIGLRLGYSF